MRTAMERRPYRDKAAVHADGDGTPSLPFFADGVESTGDRP